MFFEKVLYKFLKLNMQLHLYVNTLYILQSYSFWIAPQCSISVESFLTCSVVYKFPKIELGFAIKVYVKTEQK